MFLVLDEKETHTGTSHQQVEGAEVLIAEGGTVAEAFRRIGVTQQTLSQCRMEYGRIRMDQVRRLNRLEYENSRLRRAVADMTLDYQILKEMAEGNF